MEYFLQKRRRIFILNLLLALKIKYICLYTISPLNGTTLTLIIDIYNEEKYGIILSPEQY